MYLIFLLTCSSPTVKASSYAARASEMEAEGEVKYHKCKPNERSQSRPSQVFRTDELPGQTGTPATCEYRASRLLAMN